MTVVNPKNARPAHTNATKFRDTVTVSFDDGFASRFPRPAPPPPPPLPPLCAAPYPAVPRDGDDGAADDDAPRLWLLLFLEEEEPYPHRERFASFALLPRLVPAPQLDDGAAPASPRRILCGEKTLSLFGVSRSDTPAGVFRQDTDPNERDGDASASFGGGVRVE
mmetsp:Transcript_62431/g.151172  ORF Transcript_62431/g.151172 Transcript_62431/m.151172 type:complete len:165 (+) Transcript_62431:292-786(+)